MQHQTLQRSFEGEALLERDKLYLGGEGLEALVREAIGVRQLPLEVAGEELPLGRWRVTVEQILAIA